MAVLSLCTKHFEVRETGSLASLSVYNDSSSIHTGSEFHSYDLINLTHFTKHPICLIVYLEVRELICDFGATQFTSEHRKNSKIFYSATLLNSFLSPNLFSGFRIFNI